MTTPTWVTLIVSFITDFIISAGGALSTAMVATGSTSMPTKATTAFAIVTGLIAASRRIQALLQVPPVTTK